MKKAIIACEVFYKEVTDIIDDENIDIELLPQGLHDLPESEDMKAKIQEQIDDLESEKDYDYIILGYGYCSGGVEGLKAENACLVIPKVHDCIPLLLGDMDIEGDIENRKTYYLSRGWIDCGGDSYKQYCNLINNDKLQEMFNKYEKKNQKVRVNWYEKDKYNSDRHYPEETAKYVCGECIKNYNSITLIDNGNLVDIHYDYTEKMCKFLGNLLKEQFNKELEYKKMEGNLSLLQDLIFFNELAEETKENLLICEPGEKLKLEQCLL